MKLDYDSPTTLWMCVDCIMHHANGECGNCHSEEGHDEEPLNRIDHTRSAMGLPKEEHECRWRNGTHFGECDCETINYSTSSCDGCGSHLHGERHAMTEWPVKDLEHVDYPHWPGTLYDCPSCEEIMDQEAENTSMEDVGEYPQ